MPELPEVETMRRGILGVRGSRIVDIVLVRGKNKPIGLHPAFPAMRKRLLGRSVAEVDRAGKRVVLQLDNTDRLIFEPRMTGLVLPADPPDHVHLRMQLDFDGAIERLWFWDRRGLGSVHLLTAEEFSSRLGPAVLGPDALTLTVDVLRERLGRSVRPIKVALLDQGAIAGIGNLYASEILHVARLDPRTPCRQLRRGQWERLQQAIGDVLHDAIRYEGSTLSDGTYRNALNTTGSYQNHHRVYDRAGEPCKTCEIGTIQRFVQAQRSTFFCARCQTRRR